MHNKHLGEHLLSEDAITLTFEDAIKHAEAFECVQAECNHFQGHQRCSGISAKWSGQVVMGLVGKEQ